MRWMRRRPKTKYYIHFQYALLNIGNKVTTTPFLSPKKFFRILLRRLSLFLGKRENLDSSKNPIFRKKMYLGYIMIELRLRSTSSKRTC